MNVKVFNVALLLGWLMVLAGGVMISPGWGIAIAGALLLVLSMVSAYLVGLYTPASTRPDATTQAGSGSEGT